SANGKLPENIKDKDGKPILSWRVALLPYLELQPISDKMKLDEPWDSPANKPMSQMRIKVYFSPTAAEMEGAKKDEYGMTNYVGVAGPGTAFDPKGGLRFQDFTDGTSNTIGVVETAKAVPWAKPDDFEFDPSKPLPTFGFPDRPTFNVGFMDGSVRAISTG